MLLPLFLCCSNTSNKEKETGNHPNDTVYLSLYFIRNDETTKKTEGELFIFAKYNNGRYFEVSDYDTISNNTIPERKSILEREKSFYVYYQGKLLEHVMIDSIKSSSYDCSDVTVGKCDNRINSELIHQRLDEYSQYRAGSISGKEIQYSLTNFLAPSSNLSQPEIIFLNDHSSDSSQSSIVNENLKASFRHYCDTLSPTFIFKRKFLSKMYYKDEPSPVYVSISICSDTVKDLFLSLVNIFRIDNDKIVPLFEKFQKVEPGSWGSGFEFIDAMDFDLDNIPELIFRVDGYEASGVEIYKYHDGHFSLVFETVMYGC